VARDSSELTCHRVQRRTTLTVARLVSAFLPGAEVLTAAVMKSSIFWAITPCSPLKVNRRLGGTYRLHLQGRRINKARNQLALLATCSHANFLLRLFLHPEDGVKIFLRNVGLLLMEYMALYAIRQYSSIHFWSFMKHKSSLDSATAQNVHFAIFTSRSRKCRKPYTNAMHGQTQSQSKEIAYNKINGFSFMTAMP
jgi:hypothetical protein